MKIRIFKFLSLVLITVFLITRVSALAHATKYGNGPHKHNGKTCVLTVISEDDDDGVAIIPAGFSLSIPSLKNYFLRPQDCKLDFVSLVAASVRDPPKL